MADKVCIICTSEQNYIFYLKQTQMLVYQSDHMKRKEQTKKENQATFAY